VINHERRAPGVAVFTCRTRRLLPFRAGQHVTIECPYLPWRSRAFSMANAPRVDGLLEFHVRATGSGTVADALVHRLKPGDCLRLSAPRGSLTLDPYSRRDLVFVTGGVGLAPAKALIDELVRYNRTRWIHLFRGERLRSDFYDRANIDRLVERHPWLTVVRATSEEPDEHGSQECISEVVCRYGSWTDHDIYVSGSTAMVSATTRRLEQAGVPAARIRCHAYPAGQNDPCLALGD
jgi:NAD(P)H-flavin reductase